MKKTIYKDDVYTFINKVESKAINAINKKYEEKITEAVRQYLSKYQDVKAIIDRFQYTLKPFASVYSEYRKVLTDNFGAKSYNLESFSTFLEWEDGKASPVDLVSSIERMIFKSYEQMKLPPAFAAIKADYHKELKETRDAYGKVKAMVVAAPNGNKGVEILKELGFDVSYFDRLEKPETKVDINTEKLFPCGERN